MTQSILAETSQPVPKTPPQDVYSLAAPFHSVAPEVAPSTVATDEVGPVSPIPSRTRSAYTLAHSILATTVCGQLEHNFQLLARQANTNESNTDETNTNEYAPVLGGCYVSQGRDGTLLILHGDYSASYGLELLVPQYEGHIKTMFSLRTQRHDDTNPSSEILELDGETLGASGTVEDVRWARLLSVTDYLGRICGDAVGTEVGQPNRVSLPYNGPLTTLSDQGKRSFHPDLLEAIAKSNIDTLGLEYLSAITHPTTADRERWATFVRKRESVRTRL